jgi:hypothetical protein
MRHASAFVLAALLGATPAGALPDKQLLDEDGVPVRDVAFVLRSIKADGWTPAKPIIDKLTVVMMVPVRKTASGYALDRFVLAQSEVDAKTTQKFRGELSKQKIAGGMKPIIQPAPHLFVVDHPVPVDEAQTKVPMRIVVHAGPTDGRLTLFILFRGAFTRVRAPAHLENRIAVDESSFFRPTKTHTVGLDIPGERLRDLSNAERELLTHPNTNPAALVRLMDALALTGDARAAARGKVFASGDQPVEPTAPVAP